MSQALSAPSSPEGWRHLFSKYLFWASPLALALMIGLFTVDGGFVLDDKAAIIGNPLVVKESIPLSTFFLSDFWGNSTDQGVVSWRPVLPMIWRLSWAITPGSPLIFRLITVLLHLMATAMVLLLGYRLYPDRRIIWAAGALFAVHPIHSEALGGIVSQADILAATLGLMAIYLSLRPLRLAIPWLVIPLLIISCLAKESAIVFTGIVAVVSLMHDRGPLRYRLSISFGAALVAVCLIAIQLSFKRAVENPFDNLAFAAHGGERILHALYVIGRGISMCFMPLGMSPFHDYAAIDLSYSTLLPYAIPGALFTLIGICSLGILLRKRSITGFIVCALLFGPILINSSLLVPVGTELAERLLYPASVASSALSAFFVCRLIRSDLNRLIIVLLVLIFSLQSWAAQRPWRNEFDLSRHGLEVEPLSGRLHVFYGNSLLAKGTTPDAAWHFMVASYIFSHFPNRVDPIPIMELEQLPMKERIIQGPMCLRPRDPCGFLKLYFWNIRTKNPHLIEYVKGALAAPYQNCEGK